MTAQEPADIANSKPPNNAQLIHHAPALFRACLGMAIYLDKLGYTPLSLTEAKTAIAAILVVSDEVTEELTP